MDLILEQQPDDPLTTLIGHLQARNPATPPQPFDGSYHHRGHGSAARSGDHNRGGGWTAQAWVSSLGIAEAVASALIPGVPKDGGQQLAAVRALGGATTFEDLVTHLAGGELVPKLVACVLPALRELAATPPSSDGSDLQSKFAGGIQLSYASLDTFYSGLEGRIGEPQPNVFETMLAEHRKRADSHVDFVTGNYGIKTTSALEWAFVVSPEGGVHAALPRGAGGRARQPPRDVSAEEWPTEATDKLPDSSLRRRVEPFEKVLERMAEVNARLRDVHEPELIKEEVTAARL